MIIVAAVGKMAAGKGIMASVAEKRSYAIIKFREVVEAEAKRRKADYGALTLVTVGDQMRKESGQEVVAKGVEKLILLSKSKKVFLEGMRSQAELAYLRGKFPEMKVVGIISSDKDRLARALARNRSDDPKSVEGIMRKDALESSWGVEKALANADCVIENSGTIGEFELLSDELLAKLEGKDHANR